MPIPIYFNIKEAREQLVNHNVVYTLRENKKKEGETQVRKSKDKGLFPFEILGFAKISFVKEITNPYDLKDYIPKSGFRTIDDWLEKAGDSRFLHKVELIK